MTMALDNITWDQARTVFNKSVTERGEWAGCPMPVDHVKLVMEPRYPYQGIHGMKWGEPKPAAVSDDSFALLNEWFCTKTRRHVFVCREANGLSKVYTWPEGPGHRLTLSMNTLGVAAQAAWSIEAEGRAVDKLKSLVTAQAFKCYTLSGMFLETSARSGVMYVFRKLRPTLALRPDADGNMGVLTALCMHPLGYYEESWAGVMTPTDDVIAHLVLMRGDEHRFWKKSNHHAMSTAAAGV